jgi:formyl-CoA transferase
MGDSLAGTYAALGAMAALNARTTTGRGQIVDSAIYEAVLAMMEASLTEWDAIGHQRERTGAVLPDAAGIEQLRNDAVI